MFDTQDVAVMEKTVEDSVKRGHLEPGDLKLFIRQALLERKLTKQQLDRHLNYGFDWRLHQSILENDCADLFKIRIDKNIKQSYKIILLARAFGALYASFDYLRYMFNQMDFVDATFKRNIELLTTINTFLRENGISVSKGYLDRKIKEQSKAYSHKLSAQEMLRIKMIKDVFR